MSARQERALRELLLARFRRRFGGGLLVLGAGRSLALTRNSGLLSNTGSRRAPDCPRFDAIMLPNEIAGGNPPVPEGHAKRSDLRAR